MSKKIAILSSGKSRGSNFLAIYEHIVIQNLPVQIDYIIVTDLSAPIVQLAKQRDITVMCYEDTKIKINDFLVNTIMQNPVELIVLAGFMRKLNSSFFQFVSTPIVNVHPALLPKYGGKGMFGAHVHQAVFNAGERESGATVHFANEHYDKGDIIYQKKCDITDCNSPEEIGKKVLQIEHEIYPKVIAKLLQL